MPKELRADLHARLASWLEARAGEQLDRSGGDRRLPPRAGVPRARGARSGQRRARAIALKAGRLLGRAGRRALDRDEFAAAARSSSARAGSSRSSPPKRAALLPDLGRALRGAGALDAADAALAEAIEDAKRHDDEPTELRAEMERAQVAFMRAPPDPDAAARHRATGDRCLRGDRQRRRPRGRLAAHGHRRTRRARPRRAAHGARKGP